jgi:hypothetical protein
MTARTTLRIANCSGFYGDRFSAAREMVEGGPIDVLTGDYLAELTMLILWKTQQRSADAGYAVTFLKQMEQVLGTCLDSGIRVVSNAGGLNPAGLARQLAALGERLGLHPKVAYIDGDDLLPDLADLQAQGHSFAHLETGQSLAASGIVPVTANAYLGAWGIVDALDSGADIVVCPRVTDASLVVGPSAWAFGWDRQDWDRIAGAVVAGHVLECGAHATGGNFSFFGEIADALHPGLPIAEMAADGSSVITKHPGTGGQVSVDTVTAQLLYETDTPHYLTPDVVARFETIELHQDGPDRVAITGVRGAHAPDTAKVCINYSGGYRNSVTFLLTGLDIEAKARLAEEGLWAELGGRERFDEVAVRLIRTDRDNAGDNAEAVARLTITVKDQDPDLVGRAFFDAAVGLALSTYPGMFTDLADRRAEAFGVYWPALIPADTIRQRVVLPNGRQQSITYPPSGAVHLSSGDRPASADTAEPLVGKGEMRRAPLGAIVGARSGDKGGNANVGLWARTDEAFAWLSSYLDVDRFRAIVPETAELMIERFELPNLRALNFVVHGLLQDGVAASTRPDPQAKGLGEYVRSRLVDIPAPLLDSSHRGVGAEPVQARGSS